MMRSFWMTLFVLNALFSAIGQRNKVVRGFSELNAKNYGFAKQCFSENVAKNPSISAFGRALLYGKTQEFKQIDSALYYTKEAIRLFPDNYTRLSRKRRAMLEPFGWSIDGLNGFLQDLYAEKFEDLRALNELAAIDQFLQVSNDYAQRAEVINLRDSLYFLTCGQNQLACLIQLKLLSPYSKFMDQILGEIEALEFKRWVHQGTEEAFYAYILYHPKSAYKLLAEDELCQIYLLQNDTTAFKRFIQSYPANKNIDKIWRAFYQLSAGNYDQSKMQRFILRYPMYPYADNVRAELERFGKELYPCANSEGLLGYMDEQGEVVIPAVYDWAGDFKEGLAVVMRAESYGVINKQGQIHMPVAFEFISDYHNGYAIFSQDSKFGLVNRAGLKVIDNQFSDLEWAFGDLLIYERDGLKGLMDVQGGFLSPLVYNEVNPVNEMLAIVSVDGLFGVINSSQMKVIPMEYEQIIQNEQGFMVVKDGLRGLFDPFGKQLLPVEFNEIGEISHGFRVVRKGNLFSHVNCLTWEVADYWYPYFPDAMRWSKMVNGQFLIQKNKKLVFVDTLQHLTKLFPVNQLNSVAEVLSGIKEKNGSFGFWDRNGKELSPFQFDYVEPLRNGQYLVTWHGQQGIYSSEGRSVIPCLYDELILWNENNYYVVQKGSKKGIFTTDGTEILPPEFDWVKKYNDQCWVLKQEGELMYFFPSNTKWIKLSKR